MVIIRMLLVVLRVVKIHHKLISIYYTAFLSVCRVHHWRNKRLTRHVIHHVHI